MTEERKKWARQLAKSMTRCADPKEQCAGCLFDHVCDKQEESGLDIMMSGANMILELLTEVDDLSTVNGHLKEMGLENHDSQKAIYEGEYKAVDVSKALEWLEGYTMTDTKQVYSNGAVFVPLFRVKQAFEDKDYNGLLEG